MVIRTLILGDQVELWLVWDFNSISSINTHKR